MYVGEACQNQGLEQLASYAARSNTQDLGTRDLDVTSRRLLHAPVILRTTLLTVITAQGQ